MTTSAQGPGHELPPAVRQMIDATNAEDSTAFLSTFAEDAVVDDWGRRFTGRAEIAAWNARENIGTHNRIEVTGVSPAGDNVMLTIVSRLQAVGCVFAEDEAALLISAAGTPSDLAAMGGTASRRPAARTHPRLGRVLWSADCRGPWSIRTAPPHRVPRPTSRRRRPAGSRPRRSVLRLGRSGHRPGPGRQEGRVVRVDVHPAAVRCARRNVAAAGQVYEGDLFEPLPAVLRGRVDLVVANAPYVPTGAIEMLPPEARVPNHWWRSTVAWTGLTSSGGWPLEHRDGWPRAATSWSRRASVKRHRPPRSSPAKG